MTYRKENEKSQNELAYLKHKKRLKWFSGVCSLICLINVINIQTLWYNWTYSKYQREIHIPNLRTHVSISINVHSKRAGGDIPLFQPIIVRMTKDNFVISVKVIYRLSNIWIQFNLIQPEKGKIKCTWQKLVMWNYR